MELANNADNSVIALIDQDEITVDFVPLLITAWIWQLAIVFMVDGIAGRIELIWQILT